MKKVFLFWVLGLALLLVSTNVIAKADSIDPPTPNCFPCASDPPVVCNSFWFWVWEAFFSSWSPQDFNNYFGCYPF
jgi:hypothetical protein